MASQSKSLWLSDYHTMGCPLVEKRMVCTFSTKYPLWVGVRCTMGFPPVAGWTLRLLSFDVSGCCNHSWSTGNLHGSKRISWCCTWYIHCNFSTVYVIHTIFRGSINYAKDEGGFPPIGGLGGPSLAWSHPPDLLQVT